VLEKDIERWCRDYATQRGALMLKFTSPGTAGVPDRVLITQGGTVFVEFKREGGKATPLQKAVMRKITNAGGHCYVITSREAFTELLETVSAGGRDAPLRA